MNRIKLDLDRTLGTIDRNVFGGFVEHLGRCVYGGIYDPGSPLAGPRRAAIGRQGGDRRSAPGQRPLSRRQLRVRLSLARWRRPGRGPPAAGRARLGVRRAEHLRDQRVHRLLPEARCGALPRRELRRRRPARGARLGRVLQRHHRHGPGPAARASTAIPSRTASATGASATRSTVPGRSARRPPAEYARAYHEFAKVMRWTDPDIRLIASATSDWDGDIVERAQAPGRGGGRPHRLRLDPLVRRRQGRRLGRLPRRRRS